MTSRHQAARPQGENSPAYLRVIRGAIVLMAAWVTLSVMCAEVVGFPNGYGWPLLILRPVGFPQPPGWIVVVDIAAGCVSIGAAAAVGLSCRRAISRQIQFRLRTLFGATAVAAVVAAIWKATKGRSMALTFPCYEADGITTSVMFNPVLHVYSKWFPPLAQIRLGVLLGLACAIYVAGRSFIVLGMRCIGPTRRDPRAAGPISE